MQREKNKTLLQKFFMVYCNINNKMLISSKALQKRSVLCLKNCELSVTHKAKQ